MKIAYMSDIHINHYVKWITNQQKWEYRTKQWVYELLCKEAYHVGRGYYSSTNNVDVLVIDGDFGEWNCQALWVLEELSIYFKRIYVTLGNHDYYLVSKSQKNKYKDSLGRIKEFIEKAGAISNVVPLVKTTDTYNGIKFAGDMLWYLPSNDVDWNFFWDISNDSNYIYAHGCSKEEMLKIFHAESMDWYQNLSEVDVMVSHVPPIVYPDARHKVNGCYVVHVDELKAKHWICGHTHDVGVVSKAGTTFYWNCFGYPTERKDLRLHMFEI